MPYKRLSFNLIEQREMLASIVTMYCSLVFIYDEETTLQTQILLFAVIALVNFYFFTGFIYVIYTACFPKKLINAKVSFVLKYASLLYNIDLEKEHN